MSSRSACFSAHSASVRKVLLVLEIFYGLAVKDDKAIGQHQGVIQHVRNKRLDKALEIRKRVQRNPIPLAAVHLTRNPGGNAVEKRKEIAKDD